MAKPTLTCLEPAASTDAATRRAAPRFQSGHVTFYRSAGDRKGESELATVQDISVSGIGLLVRAPIKPGMILVVELQSTVRNIRHQRLARVTHATDQGNGYALLGCEFANRLSDAELQTLAH